MISSLVGSQDRKEPGTDRKYHQTVAHCGGNRRPDTESGGSFRYLSVTPDPRQRAILLAPPIPKRLDRAVRAAKAGMATVAAAT